MLISLLNTLIKQLLQLLLTVSQPASTGCIRRHSLASLSLLNTVLLATLDLLEHGQRLLGGNSIRDVAEVNAAYELLGGHVRNNAPDRLAQGLGPQIPEAVDDGTQSQVDDTLLGADPAQLAVGDQVAPGLTPVGGELVEVFANDERGKKGNGSADNFIAATDSEGLYI